MAIQDIRGAAAPVWREVVMDTATPVSLFEAFRGEQFAFLLESAPSGSETFSRYSIIGSGARRAWRLTDGVVEDWLPDIGWHAARQTNDPIADLGGLLRYESPVIEDLGPFWNGAVGYLGYDVVRHIERLPDPPTRDTAIPDALLVFPRAVAVVDSLRSRLRAIAVADSDVGRTAAEHEVERMLSLLATPPAAPSLPPAGVRAFPKGLSSYERADFMRDVERCREHIFAGDCFQVLLSRRIELAADFDTRLAYRALRAINPSPYMYHLSLDGVELFGSSPELLVRVHDGAVTVRPIAGTRPRPASDDLLERVAAELSDDPKERAEHLMLVDLGRNDVGRVARYGSVKVEKLMEVERYSHVLHLVSEVRGELAAGCDALDALRACFPAGTMTGAPKVRAMQIVDSLEPVRRGCYAGAVGHISAGLRRMDLAIAIRSCVVHEGRAFVQAGAGIVADSVPEREWEETERKAAAVLQAIAQARAHGQ